jgi:MFS family permease
MHASPAGRPLLTFHFLALCLLIFLTYCNITVFYTLYVYLEQLGVAARWRGPLIGASSLAAILAFLALSARMGGANAARSAGLGVALLLACGSAYLWVADPWGILALRLMNGLGVYLVSAGAMTLLVARIPPERSGQAFSFYSVAILLPYSITPLAFDFLSGHLPSLAHGYALMSLALAPTLPLLWIIQRRHRRAPGGLELPPATFRAMANNAAHGPVALLLGLNALYILTFSAMFFLAKGLFASRGLDHVGFFFSIQTACMIVVRLGANRIFDQVSRLRLIRVTFVLSAASFGLVAASGSVAALSVAALILGLGMGLGSPALYALMFQVSAPRFKAMNSNLMMMALQVGNMLGPILGGAAVEHFGYAGFLGVNCAACGVGLALCWSPALRRADPGPGAA